MLIVVLRDFEQLEGMAENVLAYSLYVICLGGNTHLPSFLIYLLSPATVHSLRILETTTRSADGETWAPWKSYLCYSRRRVFREKVFKKFGIAHRLSSGF